MLERLVLALKSKGYSWKVDYDSTLEALVVTFSDRDVNVIENYQNATNVYAVLKGERVRYYEGKGPREMNAVTIDWIRELIETLPGLP